MHYPSNYLEGNIYKHAVCCYVLWCNCMADEVQLRIDMKGKEAQQFKAVKEDLGLTTNTEVCRFLIKQHYDKLKDKLQERS